MTISSAWWVYGSLFKLGDGAGSEVFTTVAEITDISGPNFSRDSIEVTNLDSTTGWREQIPGWRDGDSVSLTANWLPTNVTQDGTTGMYSHFTDNVNHNYQIVLPTAVGLTISLTGHITGFPITLPIEEQAQVDFEIKISGVVTIA